MEPGFKAREKLAVPAGVYKLTKTTRKLTRTPAEFLDVVGDRLAFGIADLARPPSVLSTANTDLPTRLVSAVNSIPSFYVIDPLKESKFVITALTCARLRYKATKLHG